MSDTIYTKNVGFGVVLLLILILGASLRIHNLSTVQTRHSDEYIYTYQAYNIAKNGKLGIQTLITRRNENPNSWFYPPPSRIGYTYLLSLLLKISHNYSIGFGANLSCFFSILSLLLLILFGLRFFNKWSTLIASAFLATSPMAIALARRTWQDSLVGFYGTLLLYITCEIISNPHKRFWYFPLVILGGLGLLIKTSLVVFFALCVTWILWDFIFLKKIYFKAILLTLFSGISLMLSFLTLVYFMGGITNLITIWAHWKNAMPINPYVISYQMGPWYRIFTGYWMLGQSNTFLFAAALITLPIMRFIIPRCSTTFNNSTATLATNTKLNISLGLLLIILAFTLTAGIVPYCQNIRYISELYVSYYLIVGFMLYFLFAMIKKYLNFKPLLYAFIVTALVAVISIQEYRLFHSIFIKKEVVGTAVGLILQKI